MLHLRKPSHTRVSAWVGRTTTPDAQYSVHMTWFVHELWQITVFKSNSASLSKLSKHYHKFPHPSLTSPTADLIRLHKIKLADVDDWIDLRLNKGMAWNSFGANWNRKWSQRELNWLWWKVCWPDTHTPVCAESHFVSYRPEKCKPLIFKCAVECSINSP